jgi:hypothetical protein
MFSLSTATSVAILIAFIGWLIAIWQTIIANKNKKSAVIFENRLQIYNEYFNKIDNINERLMIDFHEFIGPKVSQVYKAILTNPNNSSQALIEMQEALSQMQLKSTKNINQATQELQKLRFIASKKTLEILDEYKKLAESQINKIAELLGTIDFRNFTTFDPEINNDLKAIGERLIELRNNLEKQMRDDLGID